MKTEINDDVNKEKTVENKNNDHKKSRFFETYISKVLKLIAPDDGITSNAKQQLNGALCFLAKRFSDVAVQLTLISGKKTLSIKEIRNSISSVVEGELKTDILNFSSKALELFHSAFLDDEKTKKKNNSRRQDRAGIIFPASVSERFLRNFGFGQVMITKETPIFLASALEYITKTILLLASTSSKNNNRVRITIRDLELSIKQNRDLSTLFNKCSISFLGGGVIPGIHESLLTKKPKKKKKDTLVPSDIKKPRRFRPGTLSLREIKRLQKVSNCLTMSKFPFERLIRTVVNNYNNGMKISKDLFVVLQYYIEQYVINFLRDSNLAAIHCNRIKLLPVDLLFINSLRQEHELDVTEFIFNKGDTDDVDNTTENNEEPENEQNDMDNECEDTD